MSFYLSFSFTCHRRPLRGLGMGSSVWPSSPAAGAPGPEAPDSDLLVASHRASKAPESVQGGHAEATSPVASRTWEEFHCHPFSGVTANHSKEDFISYPGGQNSDPTGYSEPSAGFASLPSLQCTSISINRWTHPSCVIDGET